MKTLLLPVTSLIALGILDFAVQAVYISENGSEFYKKLHCYPVRQKESGIEGAKRMGCTNCWVC